MSENVDKRIAVIGVSAILPGGENINSCWETIKEGLDTLSDLPSDRVDVTAYYDPVKTTKDKIYCKRGGFIPDFNFDAREFGMNMFQVEDADTNQTLTLLKVKEALEDAGIDPFSHQKKGAPKKKKNIGVVLGIGGGQKASNEFYSRMNYTVVEKVLSKIGLPKEDVDLAVEKFKANFPEWRLDSFPGFLGNVTAGRCTNVFDLDGMNCVVDAACASSLIALKVAIDEILYGNCKTMICGATCTDNSIGMYMAFSKTPVFSTDQSLTAYDKNTKGMLIGEGSVMLVLKKYTDALADGDDIHCVINGVASSSDGKASGIYSPTVSGQELAIRRAYEKAGVDPKDVSLIEGHGTGTPVGDRIELTALKNVFTGADAKQEQIAVGSIKSQIAHLKACAGFAGMVKVIMALKHKTLPGTINVKIPPVLYDNTLIQDSPIYINTQSRPWFTDGGKARIAGVSSFGFGGANYHAVLTEAEAEVEKPYRVNEVPKIFVVRARSAQALVSELTQIKKSLATTVEAKEYTTILDLEKKHGVSIVVPVSAARVGFVSTSFVDLKSKVDAALTRLSKSTEVASFVLPREQVYYRSSGEVGIDSKLAALFSGQGSQYLHMFDEVAMNWPTFRSEVNKVDRSSEKVCDLRASSVLYPRKPYDNETKLLEEQTKTLGSVQNAQLSTVAVSLGAYNVFKQANFNASFYAGHSLGELSALIASGVLSESAAFELVAQRAYLMETSTGSKPGKMFAIIGKGAEDVKPSEANVWIANFNSPEQVILTGEADAVQREARKLSSTFKVVELKVADAFHSPYMKPANTKLSASIKKTSAQRKSCKFYSNVTGKQVSSPTEVISNLSKHMESSVKFTEQIRNMYDAGARVFVEFGPKNTLGKLVESILKGKEGVSVVSVNSKGGKAGSELQLREAAMQLAVIGVEFKNFDPWVKVNKFKVAAGLGVKKKTQLRLKASTYVSSKTIKERERIMNDGRTVSLLKGVSPSVSSKDKELFEQKLKNREEEIDLLKSKVSVLEKKLESKEETSSHLTSTSAELTAIKKHREMIVSMLGEYDRLLENLSEAGEAKLRIPREIQTDAVAANVVKSAPKAVTPAKVIDQGLLNRAEQAEEVVLAVLAEKTGYEVEMIELDMELETELGIDSIKRVEILSEVQDQLNVEAKDVDALSRTRTVGEVIDALKKEMGSVPTSAAPVAASTPVPASSSPAVDSSLLNKAEQVVLEVLAEKTGYEVDMIELDMELETELGIDSIKRVEILSEVQDQLNVEAKDVDALSRTRTVGEVIDALKKEMGSVPASAAPVAASTPVPASSSPAVDSSLLNKAEQVVLEVLAEKTGYEVDMIELDMELETELGIDSIKRVEILSEVQDQLNVEAKDPNTNGWRIYVPASAAPVAASTPVPASSSPAVDSSLLNKAEQVVLEVLAEKTGYEVDMIELDMELETELGIDSIKRVEILSEVQDQLNVEAKDVDALSRTRTVGEVIDALKKEMGSVPASAAPVAASTPVPASSSPAVDSSLLNKAEQVVLEVLAEKTGYEVDMIELDMELETELGIDSIKRVEILSEVQDQLNVEAKDVDALSRTRTVGEVIDALKKEMGASSAPVSAPVASSSTPAVDSGLLNKAEQVVLEVLAEKTGYEVDMIELDMELETELGIDSIKRVEILSEVQDQLNVEAKDVDALSRTRTVGEVIEALKNEMSQGSTPGSKEGSVEVSKPIEVPTAIPADKFDSTDFEVREEVSSGLNLSVPELVQIDNCLAVPSELSSLGKIHIVDLGNEPLAAEFKKKIPSSTISSGYVSGPNVVVVVPSVKEKSLGETLMLFKKMGLDATKSLKKVLVAFSHEGTLGYDFAQGSDLKKLQIYGLCGLVKTATHEWPQVQLRAVDISNRISSAKAADLILSELCDPSYTRKEVCYDAEGQRYAPEVTGLSSYTDRSIKPSASDVWLVAGGGRGITPLCIAELAKELNGGTFYLIGRSQLKEVPEWAQGVEGFESSVLQKAAITYFKSKGEKVRPSELRKLINSVAGTLEVKSNLISIGKYATKVEYVSCDITSADAVKKLFKDLSSQGVKVSSLFHASGVLRDKLIIQKTMEEFNAVYSTKVDGFFNIASGFQTSGCEIKNLVLFSSLAGYFGNVGQSDYSIANEVLNKLAYFYAPRATVSQAFDFGPWDGGMVTPALKKKFIEGGVQIIDRQSGAATVARIIVNAGEKKQVLVGNWASIPYKRLDANNSEQTIFFTKKSSLKAHKIKGKEVVPFVSVVHRILTAVQGVYPGWYVRKVDEAKLFRGVSFDQNVSQVHAFVKLTELSASKDSIKVKAEMKQQVNGRKVPSYKIIVELGSSNPADIAPKLSITKSGKDMTPEDLYDGVTLFHLKGLQPITKIIVKEDSSSLSARIFKEEVNLSERFPVEDVVLDAVFQSGLVLSKSGRDVASLPVSLEDVEFGSLYVNKRSYKNVTINLHRESKSEENVWKLKFEIVEESVIVRGRASIALNSSLRFN
eukprot:maker-scaffold_118-snap-gene-0.1-mRNA-1 protein AED:0.05 eAED:0.08 QI:0/0/0/1/0.25/0.2/5/0/2488